MRQKLWKIIRKTYVVEFPCKKLLQLQEYSLQPKSFSSTLQPRSPEYMNIRKNIFSGDVGKTAVKKVLKNYQKNACSSVPFKKFELSNPQKSYSKQWQKLPGRCARKLEKDFTIDVFFKKIKK